jgi:hypothetical protein
MMNFPRTLLSVATATTILGLVSTASANAFTLTTQNYIQGDGSTLEFGFLGSYGAFQSSFGIYNVTTRQYTTLFQEINRHSFLGQGLDNYGDATNINVLQTQFTFESNNQYTFFLGNNGESATVYSTTDHNTDTPYKKFGQQAQFFSDLSVLDDQSYRYLKPPSGLNVSTQSALAKAEGTIANLLPGKTGLIAFEDNGIDPTTNQWYHRDYNDFLVSAQVVQVSVPEPATLIGLGMIAGAMALVRRHRKEGNFS